jgi:hypothetical protein
MALTAKGLVGAIEYTQGRRAIDVARAVHLEPASASETSYVDIRTSGPLTLSLSSTDGLTVEVISARMFGTDVNVQGPFVRTAEYRFRGNGRVRGTFHATTVAVWRAYRMLFENEAVTRISLSSQAGQVRSGPVEFVSGPGKSLLRILLSNPAGASQGMRADAIRLSGLGASGRLVAGARPVTLSGIEEVVLVGDLAVDNLEVLQDRIRITLSGSASEVTVNREPAVPSWLELIVSRPFWTITFATGFAVWSAVVMVLLKFILTGVWSGG